MILHGYWRSTTSYRVRIGLNLKQCAYEQRTHDLRTGEQRDAPISRSTRKGWYLRSRSATARS